MSEQQGANAAQVRFVTITDAQAGQRIDNFLRTELKGVPKSMIYRIVRKGELRVNKKRVKPEYRLQIDDLVRIPPLRVAERDAPPPVSDGMQQHLEDAILYEDADLLVINKPSGLAVHGGSGVSLGLIEALRQIRPQARFLELVHRLDRDTSGCIMVAKKRSALKFMHEALQRSKVTKIYHALVCGHWSASKRRVDAPLRKNELKSGERVVKVQADGKAALTEFKVLNRFGRQATLVEARPITGRTHQIRVHAQFEGHPIVGDDKYGIDEINRQMKTIGFRRLFLHAAELRIPLPSGGRKIIEAPLDETLIAAMERLAAGQRGQQQQKVNGHG
ncbi:23S rRNA pseudouridine(955/2504/2580) synthase RluC [Marinobacterium arenosum]|uniref:23S rRNA pseudouridine(955/2504/2580) synthase RluC n=1 Tax=Marinobacterium arenosum TaxID=2862496 RepID=UPI001C966F0B|nr:23S rRNA pseudouridine(955/2504/2580) synthase RluC [Marinobacterium arenosum]MBY4675259.1 23S rRNA pseudouridine(955/2504/2580) synthase RluC [Marinobacterium arenosum]